MIDKLEQIAHRIYESSRRSLERNFIVAARLLEYALNSDFANNNKDISVELKYRLGLIYRNEFESSKIKDSIDSLDKAIFYSRAALRDSSGKELFRRASISIGLSNCLFNKAKEANDIRLLEESIDVLRQIKDELYIENKFHELLSHTYNSLGSALITRLNIDQIKIDDDILEEAIDAFRNAIAVSEHNFDSEVWGSANVNYGRLLATKAGVATNHEIATFLRIQAISAHNAAIETYPSTAFPLQYAEAHCSLADVLFQHALALSGQLRDYYFIRAITSYEAAAEIYNEGSYPDRWSSIQMYLGSIYAIHGEADGAETTESDLKQAAQHFDNALRVLRPLNLQDKIKVCERALNRIEEGLSATDKKL